ncbi:7-cyano-7-deazaguanine synthase QueC [Thiohalomonas denitrificans]|uniref:7-cyano-7-deazaguanine synthase n=1 Tax=Thiohalomonas denitrificans TaxID=415747 RepID=A0A1G5PKQ6_9GAMM|nr:7-cyano-7-deazaguanine synthase QueC [Thiohalomonas denitrificans]SCZ50077.1 7-cyano-7-deazaguanine synthase [Thiohalomonas denitrificans]
MNSLPKKAVALLSGGLDSATSLAMARDQGFECYALSFDYGQRHRIELEASRRVGQSLGVREHRIFTLDLRQFGGSALTDDRIEVPQGPSEGIPVTYVPARNTIFLSLALGWAEVLGALDLFIGVNAVDYSGYPDCRPEFIDAFQKTANLATRAGAEGQCFSIHAPLVSMTKAEIIATGHRLGVDYGLTLSCYNPDFGGNACGICDSCRLRAAGFHEAGVPDPTPYKT